MKRPRLILADDHPIVVAGLRELLEPQFEVVGTAEDGRTLVKLALDLNPDLILLDISMPVQNGLTAARQIRQALPKVKLIFLTMHADIDYVKEAFRAGASGYMLKRSVASELVRGIGEVLKGRTYLTPVIAEGFEGAPPGCVAGDGTPSGGLTNREREVMQLLTEGRGSKEVAAILHVTRKTVEFHKSRMKRKLHLQTTAELIKYAVEHKIAGT